MNKEEAKRRVLQRYNRAKERNEDFVVEPVKFKSDEDMMRQLMPELYKKKGRSEK